MPCTPQASLAQLAEQLTLNQFSSAKNPEENAIFDQRAALRAAVDVNETATYVDSLASPAIAAIAEAWPHLPPHIREAILTLVDCSDRGEQAAGGQP